MNQRLVFGSLLLFFSGISALVYQIAWLRELRLIFGSATLATSVVLAIFLGGLGLGAMIIGPLADKNRRPLRLYAHIELGVAILAALSPFLIMQTSSIYLAVGGSTSLGNVGATLVRLLLSILVLGGPTLLMGGTLPLMARVVEEAEDTGRRRVGLLYGGNTLGAVVGCLGATFFLLEHLGTDKTIWLAASLNILVAMAAYLLAYKICDSRDQTGMAGEPTVTDSMSFWHMLAKRFGIDDPASRFISLAAVVTGFIFLVMELVWNRMLTPLLGGSTYTFGLILGVALLGLGFGGWLFGMRRPTTRGTLWVFSLTLALEAFFLIVPYALGDQLALFTAYIRPLSNLGFAGLVLGWFFVTFITVFPVAVLSGYQFPLLIGLLGTGGRQVGRHTGYVYGWNTVGAIVGSLLAGFVLLPVIGAPNLWLFSVGCLLLLCIITSVLVLRREKRVMVTLAPLLFVLLSLLLCTSEGPTAVWRYTPIGAGRVDLSDVSGNALKHWMHFQNRFLLSETDGVEASVAINNNDSLSFVINGKIDGNAFGDVDMQIMGPMISAILHPRPVNSMVIGLGTGSSAGWLASIDSMQKVDVVELEPAIIEVARLCAPVNKDVLANPKVNIHIGDGREVLLTSQQNYDLIFSEPSNPYRAGIASMFTSEFYQSVSSRLAENGIFTQWVQGYEIDTLTFRTIYATLFSVFPEIEIWYTGHDLLFVCSKEPRPFDVAAIRQKITLDPFRTALVQGWGAVSLEGFLSHHIAGANLAPILAGADLDKGLVNSDDRMLVEFGLARTAGQKNIFSTDYLRAAARSSNAQHPALQRPDIFVDRVVDNYILNMVLEETYVPPDADSRSELQQRINSFNAYNSKNYTASTVVNSWAGQTRPPLYPLEHAMLAEAYAEIGNDQALKYAKYLDRIWPVTATMIEARYYLRTGLYQEAFQALEKGLLLFREQPWGVHKVMDRGLLLVGELAVKQPDLAPKLFDLIDQPFSVYMLEETRQYQLLVVISTGLDCSYGEKVMMGQEPFVEWTEEVLTYRKQCYEETGNPLAPKAAKELQNFQSQKQTSLLSLLIERNDDLR